MIEGVSCDHGRDRKASSVGSDTESGDDESESSSDRVKMVTSKADDSKIDYSLVSGRAASPTSSAGRSGFIRPKRMKAFLRGSCLRSGYL